MSANSLGNFDYFDVCAMGIADRLDIYKMVYTTRFSQPYDIESRKDKKTVQSYSYLEAIDTVNN